MHYCMQFSFDGNFRECVCVVCNRISRHLHDLITYHMSTNMTVVLKRISHHLHDLIPYQPLGRSTHHEIVLPLGFARMTYHLHPKGLNGRDMLLRSLKAPFAMFFLDD